MNTFHLTVARVGESVFVGDARSVTVPGAEGALTVLAGHEPLISALVVGEVRIQDAEGKEQRIAIEGGTVEVSGGQVTVLL